MKISHLTNNISCELEMQEKMCQWLSGIEEVSCWKDEMFIKGIGRRADFLILKENLLINIEAKSTVNETLIRQLDDHATYCDYCFAFIPNFSLTPKWFKKDLVKKGYGLIIYDYRQKTISEALEAHHNKPSEKNIRSYIIGKIKEECLPGQLDLDM